MASFEEATRTAGKRRVVERHPYTGAGIDALAIQVGALLKVESAAQRIILDVTKPYIHLEKFVKGQPNPELEQEAYELVLKNVPMSEYGKNGLSPCQTLYHMFQALTDNELEVVLILVGSLSVLTKWLDRTSAAKHPEKLFGVKVRVLKNAPDDLILVCGAEWADAEIEDIKYTIKSVMS